MKLNIFISPNIASELAGSRCQPLLHPAVTGAILARGKSCAGRDRLIMEYITSSVTVHDVNQWGDSESFYGAKVPKMLWMKSAFFMKKEKS